MSNYLPLRLRVNPRRRKSRKSHRSHRVARRHNARRHKARYLVRHNPGRLGGIVKKTFTKGNLMPVAGITLGFVGGSMVSAKIRDWVNDSANLTSSSADTKATISNWIGLLNLILGAAVGIKGKGALVKSAGTGIAVSGAYDIVSRNVETLALPKLDIALPDLTSPGAGATTVKGMELGWIGTRVRNRSAASSMSGVELDGDNEDTSAI